MPSGGGSSGEGLSATGARGFFGHGTPRVHRPREPKGSSATGAPGFIGHGSPRVHWPREPEEQILQAPHSEQHRLGECHQEVGAAVRVHRPREPEGSSATGARGFSRTDSTGASFRTTSIWRMPSSGGSSGEGSGARGCIGHGIPRVAALEESQYTLIGLGGCVAALGHDRSQSRAMCC